jgi:hypothetical protein
MLTLDKLMLGLYGLLCISIGVFINLLQFHVITMDLLTKYFEDIPFSESPYLLALLGVVTVLIGLSLLNIAFYPRDKKKSIKFHTDKGDVKIVLSAIEEYIRKTTTHMKSIKEIKNKVTVKGKGLKVVCRLMLSSDSNVTNLADTIQKEIEDNLIAMIGVQIPLVVNINIVKMAVTIGENSPIDLKEEGTSEEEEPFKGIKY